MSPEALVLLATIVFFVGIHVVLPLLTTWVLRYSERRQQAKEESARVLESLTCIQELYEFIQRQRRSLRAQREAIAELRAFQRDANPGVVADATAVLLRVMALPNIHPILRATFGEAPPVTRDRILFLWEGAMDAVPDDLRQGCLEELTRIVRREDVPGELRERASEILRTRSRIDALERVGREERVVDLTKFSGDDLRAALAVLEVLDSDQADNLRQLLEKRTSEASQGSVWEEILES